MGTVFDRDAYDCQDHALAIRVTDEERAQADSPLDPDATATTLVSEGIQRAREKRIHDLVMDNDLYFPTGGAIGAPGSNTPPTYRDISSAKWSASGTDIMDHIRTAKYDMHKRIFRYPNTMIMPLGVWSKIQNNSIIVERIKYTQRGGYDLELFLFSSWNECNYSWRRDFRR